MLDKIKGGLFGVAIGDALGGTTEFMTPKEIERKYGRVTEIVGGGCWDLEPGETTDDTAMTIAVAKGIISNPDNPIKEIGKYFLEWEKTKPKDIGITIRSVFQNYNGDWLSAAKETHFQLGGKSAGNGSLMRCLPVSLAYKDKVKLEEITITQSEMTHYDGLASEACLIYNNIARRLLKGDDLSESIWDEIKNTKYDSAYDREPDCEPDGFVVHSMKWILFWLLNSKTFEEVVVGATNMGNDSDTIAAIAGGLKGIEVGYDQLPPKYKEKLLVGDRLLSLSVDIFRVRERH